MTIGITEYTAGFEYVESERGISVTTVFHFDPDSTVDGPELPAPGDEFILPDSINSGTALTGMGFPDFTGLICKSRSLKPLAGHALKYEWTISYTNEYIDPTVFNRDDPIPNIDIADLPKTLEYSGEFLNVNPGSGQSGWVYDDNGEVVAEPIGKKINTSTMRVTRYVPDSEYSDFQEQVRAIMGHVNSSDDPFSGFGGGTGTWLFVGCQTEIFGTSTNETMWRAELTFNYRDPDDLDVDGWQKVLRRVDSTWVVVKDSFGNKLYEEEDFNLLFKNTTTPP